MRQQFSGIPWWAMQTNPVIRIVGYYGWYVSLRPALRWLERIHLRFARGIASLREIFQPVFADQQSADNTPLNFDSKASNHSLVDDYESFQ